MFARSVLPAIVCGLFLLGAVYAADAPDLDELQRQNQIEAQKVDAQVTRALTDARRLELSNPETALRMLRAARALLDDVRGMDEDRRSELVRTIDGRLRTVQTALRRRQIEAEQAADRTAAAERERQRTRPAPAQRITDQAQERINKGREQIGAASGLSKRRELGYEAVGRDLDRSSLPAVRDYQLPKDWKERIARRKPDWEKSMSKDEKNLVRALNSVLSIDFDKNTFKDVINYLQEKTGTTILVDQEALKDANIEYDDPVTFTARKVAFRTVLRKILGDRGLAYILKDGVIQVVTPQRARETLVTRSYPIQDFLPVPNPFANPLFNRLQMQAAAKQIMELVQSSVEPGLWQANGGTATISFSEPTLSIVIRAPAELHYSLPSLFGR